MKILLLSRSNFEIKSFLIKYLKLKFKNVSIVLDDVENKKYRNIFKAKHTYAFLFGYEKLIKKEYLNKIKYPLNFHPAGRKYPGAGCYSYALYNKDKYHGVTCHLAIEKPDSGVIVREKRFVIAREENFLTLREKTLLMGLKLFYEIVDEIYKNNEIKFNKKLKWKKLKKHKDYLNDLLIIKNKSELKRKILINNPFKQGPWVKKKNKLKEIKLRTKLKYFYPK